jgi:hypothetical protein
VIEVETEDRDLFKSRLSPMLRTGEILLFRVSRELTRSEAERLGVELALRCASLELDVLVLPSTCEALCVELQQGLESMSLLAASLQRLELITATATSESRELNAARALLLEEDGVVVDDAGAAAFVEAIRLVRDGTPRRPKRVAVALPLAASADGTIEMSD